ncbi:cell division inhibitor SepF [Weissella uvarum]|uniref:cell division protein SepF n=1 Tax=Weissella uvarum TaxID=1479233 RepID=UPI001961028B|nr:cell division protein SepF [Weissella uvarum]MBM7617787.1 cell division inhibitor SepF [Weissella uvarum]MCM0595834.1 cell division protein SepF [Weissella uvarum]
MAFDKFKDFFGVDDTYEEEVERDDYVENDQAEQSDERKGKPVQRGNVLKMDGKRNTPAKIALYEPRTYADAQTIATQILQGEAVIVNFSAIDERNQLRVLDYIAGATFAVDGDVERVGDEIFVATPHNFEISGSISQTVSQQFGS